MRATAAALVIGSSLVLVGIGGELGCESRTTGESPGQIHVDATSGAMREEQEHPPAEPEFPPAGAWVVVAEDASFLVEPRLDGPIFEIPREHVSYRGRLAEVVGIRNDLIELRTLPPDATGCAASFEVEDRFALGFFVDPLALRTVLTRPKILGFDDGTRLELAAGVPLVEYTEDDEVKAVRVGQTRLDVELDAADFGRWYIPTPPRDEPAAPTQRWSSQGRFAYGPHVAEPDGPPFETPIEIRERDGQTFVTFVGDCGRFTFRDTPRPSAAAERETTLYEVLQHDEAETYGPFSLLPEDLELQWGCAPEHWTMPAGTPVSWSVGGEAGVATVTHVLPFFAAPKDGRVCFAAGPLSLCAAAEALEHQGDPGCRIGPRGFRIIGTRYNSSYPAEVRLEIRGELESDHVHRMVGVSVPALRDCYREHLAAVPQLAGRVVIAVEIGAAGKVTRSKVASLELEPPQASLGSCFAKVAARWDFAEPEDGKRVLVWFPFDLAPS